MANRFSQFAPETVAIPPGGGVPQGNRFSQFAPTAPAAAAPVDQWQDVGKAAIAGVPRGLADVAGIPGDLVDIGTRGAVAGINWMTGDNKPVLLPDWLPTSENVKQWTSNLTGLQLYQPQTAAGKFVGGLSE